VLFRLGRFAKRLLIGAGVVAVVWAAAGLGNAALARNENALLRIRWAKGIPENRALRENWNSFSRIRVDGDSSKPLIPYGWGFSPTLPIDTTVRELGMTIDATAATFMTHYDGDKNDVEFLRYDVVNVAHYMRPNSNVFVIGAGGGRDVLAALYFNQPSVTAVELNGSIVDTVNGQYGDFTGHLDRQPGVHFVNDEARSYLARSNDRYDIIQISLIDTWAATSAGAFALSENSLYTVEAWDTFLGHLTDTGVLSVSRWFYIKAPAESYRLTSLAAESLRRRGIDDPEKHIILIRNPRNFYAFAPDFAVGNVLVSKKPFSQADIQRIQQVANDLQFQIVVGPEPVQSDPTFAAIVQAKDPGSVNAGLPIDLSAPTDDRPFFFQMVRFRDLFDTSLYRDSQSLVQPVLVLFILSIVMIVMTSLCIVLPIVLTTSRQALRGMTPLIVFFGGIGLAFLLLEIAQLQRLIIFLGHPTYALTVLLSSLLIFSGIGSLITDRLIKPELRPTLLLPFVGLFALLVAAGIATPIITHSFDDATTPLRIFTSAAILAPMGLLMGMPFPIGMKVASLKPDAPTTFFWGINGATSVMASVLGVAIALGWGISIAFWVGCAFYIVAALALGRVISRGYV